MTGPTASPESGSDCPGPDQVAFRRSLRETPPPFITDEMARGMAEMMRQRAAVDPEFAEDIMSIDESMPYVIGPHEGPPITCECCGTPVTAVPEARVDDELPRTWTRAIWEPDTGRKHTLRRCNWKRGPGVAADPSATIE